MQGNYTNCLFQIDRDNGVITVSSHGVRILRVTHLPDPVPQNVSIDIVALPALTSYTPLTQTELGEWRDAPQGSNKTSNSELETRHHGQ